MAMLPARRTGRSVIPADPTTEFEDISINGEIKDQSDGKRHRSSRRVGRFEYRTVFPGDIRARDGTAELADGVLTVTVPKSGTARPRQVQVTDRSAAA